MLQFWRVTIRSTMPEGPAHQTDRLVLATDPDQACELLWLHAPTLRRDRLAILRVVPHSAPRDFRGPISVP